MEIQFILPEDLKPTIYCPDEHFYMLFSNIVLLQGDHKKGYHTLYRDNSLVDELDKTYLVSNPHNILNALQYWHIYMFLEEMDIFNWLLQHLYKYFILFLESLYCCYLCNLRNSDSSPNSHIFHDQSNYTLLLGNNIHCF